MPIIRPFRSVRPAADKVSAIAALPYDVYNRREAKKAVEGNPLSFLRIDRAETQFSDETDMYSREVYERSKQTLEEMREKGFFIMEEEACYYLYALTYNGHTQTGIVGCASIDDYLNGAIRRHENTKEDKEQDRIRHVDTLNAQTGPIFLTYRGHPRLKQIICMAKESEALYDFVSEDGIRHQVWKIRGDQELAEEIEEIFSHMGNVYIADGHHRAASAVKVGLKRRMEYPDYDGTEEFNYFLSVLFPAEELRILDYNRVVTGVSGRTFEELLEEIGEKFRITKRTSAFHPACKGEIAMYGLGTWYLLTAREELYTGDPVDDLDVSILQNHILEPLFGIRDPKVDSRIQFVGGIRGLDNLVRLVDEALAGEEFPTRSPIEGDPYGGRDMKETDTVRVAFAMYPTSMEELLTVADSGRLMPPKSTWFEPKLRSGLFIHIL